MMKRLAVFFLLLLGTAQACAEDATLTIDNYLMEVMASNPVVNAAQERNTALQLRVKPAATLEDPFIAFGVDEIPYGETRAQAYRYQISQAFPFPGKLHNREELASNRAHIAESDLQTRRRQLQVIATQYFYRAFYNARAIKLNQEQQALVSAAMSSAQTRYQTGGNTHHDWLLAKMELSTLLVEQHRLQREQFTLQAMMNELRGKPGDGDMPPLVANFANAQDQAVEASLNDQPELAAIDAQSAQANNEYKLAKLEYYPDFVVQVMAMEPRMKDEMNPEESNWGVMIGMNVPLYFSRKQASLVSAARHEQRALELDKQYLLNKLNTEMANARQALASATDIVRLYEKEVLPNTHSALTEARSAYEARRTTLDQYLEILKVKNTQELELLAAHIDVELARTRLKELLSTPPLMRLAPSRPSVFGNGNMGDGMQSSDPVLMGDGMSAGKTTGKTDRAPQSGDSGMSGM